MTKLHPNLFDILAICCLLFAVSCNHFKEQIKQPPPKVYVNQSIPISHIIDSLQIPQKALCIYISKKKRELHIMADSTTLKSYPVVFGFNPIDDKRTEGDGCTPEGLFVVRDRYPHKKWSKFIWVDYPTKDSWHKHQKAKKDGKIAEKATIGGQIGIHGVPNGQDFLIDMGKNWTLGCISLKNKHIDEFYPYISKGTKIEIEGFGTEN
ncbi:MAG: L,D-transpeptidase [Chitinophagales bacterium]